MSQDTTLLITTEISSLPKYYLSSIAAWFGSLAIGTIVGYTSPGIPSIESPHSHLHISKTSESWLGSLMPLGASVGALIGGILQPLFEIRTKCKFSYLMTKAIAVDKLGRKFTLMLSSVPCVFGWLMMAYSYNVSVLLIGRFLTGICVGFVSLAAPLYIAETAAPRTRGFFGSGFQLWVVTGVFLVYFKGIYLPWTWLAISNTLYPIILLIMLCFLPESPVFLMKKKLYLEATDSLLFLYGNNSDLTNPSLYATSEEDQKVSLSDFTKREIFIPLLLCLTLMFFQQFSAINAVVFYSTDILNSLKSFNVNYCIIAMAAVMVVFTFLASILMDRAGRRKLLIISGAIMTVSMGIMALFFIMVNIYGSKFRETFAVVFLISLCSFVASFSIGYGPIPWLLMSEYIPAKVKGLASGAAVSFNWLCAFVITEVFHYLLDVIHETGTYLLFAIVCLLSVLFVYFKVYETKGKTLQEIQSYFKDSTS